MSTLSILVMISAASATRCDDRDACTLDSETEYGCINVEYIHPRYPDSGCTPGTGEHEFFARCGGSDLDRDGIDDSECTTRCSDGEAEFSALGTPCAQDRDPCGTRRCDGSGTCSEYRHRCDSVDASDVRALMIVAALAIPVVSLAALVFSAVRTRWRSDEKNF